MLGLRRVLNVVDTWVSVDAESRKNDSTGIDGGRQSKGQ
jgi:hypothetical protein